MGELGLENQHGKQGEATDYLGFQIPVRMTPVLTKASTEYSIRPGACAVARLPFIHAAYTSSNYTIALYKLGMPTQLQLHLSVVALALGKVFHFLNFLNVGYLSSSIEPTHGKGTQNKSRAAQYGFNSKVSNHSGNHRTRGTKNQSISDHDSSKDLVPSNYGQVSAEIEGAGAVPMGRMYNGNGSPAGQQTPQRPNSHRQPTRNEIVVTTQYEIRNESAAENGMNDKGDF